MWGMHADVRARGAAVSSAADATTGTGGLASGFLSLHLSLRGARVQLY